MASEAREIVAGIKTALELADGSGAWSYDLRGAVRRGKPQILAFDGACEVWIDVPEIDSRREGGRTPLTQWDRILGIRIVGLVPGMDDAETRQDALLDLADTILRALEVDQQLGRRASVIEIGQPRGEIMGGHRLAEIDFLGVDEGQEMPGLAAVVITFAVKYRMSTGA